METISPLEDYLRRHAEMPYKFADRAGISRAAIYRILDGRSYGSEASMIKIERATNGEVTMSEMLHYVADVKAEKAR